MRYTGIIDDPTQAHVSYVEFDTPEQGLVELHTARSTSVAENLTMEVGEPGDEGPRWVWSIDENARVVTIANVSTTTAHNVEHTLA